MPMHPGVGTQRMLTWNVPPEEMEHIPDHWLKFPEQNPALHYLLAILYVIFTVLSVLGNGCVIYVFCV